MRPLTTTDIRKQLRQDEFCRGIFSKVIPLDYLPLRINYPSGYIFNTDPSYLPGEHWLALFYNSEGKCTFFDSFGRHPKEFRLENYLNRTSKEWEYNSTILQSLTSVTCGQYCIYFIQLMCRGFKLDEIIKGFSINDFNENDLKISLLFDKN